MSTATLMILTHPTETAAAPGRAGDPGFHAADPDSPHVNVMDLGITRGDGIFESISVAQEHPQALEAHLARLARSAALLDLPAPDLNVWRNAVFAAVEAHRRTSPTAELFAKLVMTRGIEDLEKPTGWVYVTEAGTFSAARGAGIRVVTLDRGYRHDVAQTSPWLLQGAKTLSYAVNRAALREASRRGADDVIFLSSDGYVLEGPNSSVILRDGDRIRTPETDQGILAGTTQASVFDFFRARGGTTSYARIPAAELTQADAIWLVSSVRQAAPVRRLDGVDLDVDSGLAGELNEFLLARTE